MPTFEYVALGPDGRKANGVVSADTARAARRELRFRQLTPLSLTEANTDETGQKRFRKGGLSSSDRVLATRQLAMIISSGTPVEEALGAVSTQSTKPHTRRLLATMRDRVSEGQRLSEAMADAGRAFSPLYQSVVAAGEVSGDLGLVLERLAVYLEKSQKTKRKIQTALIYPIVLALIAVAVITLLMIFVVPRIVSQFSTFEQELPMLTQIVIGMSSFVRDWGLLVLIGLVAAGFGIGRVLRQPAIKRRVDAAWLKVPIIGKLIQTTNSAKFARTFAMLLASRTPLTDSLEAARGSLSNLVFVDALDGVVRSVREGVAPASALSKADVFPPMLIHLAASGAASGNMAELMAKGADYLEDEFDGASSLALGLLEPAVILLLGGIVAMIVLSIMLPIMQLNSIAFG
ncbi:MAG: type II secretion system inner membrane protein GspF [Pseudomonadota bacterium]